jgi:type II secretory pathway pseudopilin PulG
MTRPVPRSRSGITLTEILISILIMGVGMVSLATLFPLGLQRVREASRFSRSTLLTETALNEIGARNLLFPGQFQPPAAVFASNGAPLYPFLFTNLGYFFYDPFLQDGPLPDPTVTFVNGGVTFIQPNGVYRGFGIDGWGPGAGHSPNQPYIPGPGLPVAYDPLWRQATGIPPDLTGTFHESRFAFGQGYIRPDPDGGAPSAYGLQRVTGVDPTVPGFFPAISQIFVSPEDIVFQSEGTSNKTPGFGSPVAPDMSTGQYQVDFSYTWMFTGQRADVSNVTVYEGDVVVFQNRQFALDAVNTPFGGTQYQAIGETVVEGVFGWSGTLDPLNPGYANGDDKSVLLRWPASMKDPEVKVGSFIADVTYERNNATDVSRFRPTAPIVPGQITFYPGQRCYWYRVAKKTEPQQAVAFSTDPGPYRQMIVTLTTPVRAKTLLAGNNGALQPVHVNAALVNPSVINVFSKVYYAR